MSWEHWVGPVCRVLMGKHFGGGGPEGHAASGGRRKLLLTNNCIAITIIRNSGIISCTTTMFKIDI